MIGNKMNYKTKLKNYIEIDTTKNSYKRVSVSLSKEVGK